MLTEKRRSWHSFFSISPAQVVVPRSNRLSLSIAGTAAAALASLPLAVSPASAQITVTRGPSPFSLINILRVRGADRISVAVATFCSVIPVCR